MYHRIVAKCFHFNLLIIEFTDVYDQMMVITSSLTFLHLARFKDGYLSIKFDISSHYLVAIINVGVNCIFCNFTVSIF